MDPFLYVAGGAGGELSFVWNPVCDTFIILGRASAGQRDEARRRGRGWLQVFLQDILPATARLFSIAADLKSILFGDN